jgi:hypothetical protein
LPHSADSNAHASGLKLRQTFWDAFAVIVHRSKIVERWLLFEYVGPEFTPLSKPFKTREQAEKAREKYPEYLRKTIGLGVIRTKS